VQRRRLPRGERHRVRQLPIDRPPGRPRRRVEILLADKGYSSKSCRRACRRRGTEPIVPKPKTPGINGLSKLRYVVEQTFALPHQLRRLAVRRERRLDIHDGLVTLACALICWRDADHSGDTRRLLAMSNRWIQLPRRITA
jgi:transposase